MPRTYYDYLILHTLLVGLGKSIKKQKQPLGLLGVVSVF